ncbi:hypothetical protein OAP38_04860 [Opitutales bacterium]|nr:hypothetical protein [Opitutales bacterium]
MGCTTDLPCPSASRSSPSFQYPKIYPLLDNWGSTVVTLPPTSTTCVSDTNPAGWETWSTCTNWAQANVGSSTASHTTQLRRVYAVEALLFGEADIFYNSLAR